MNCDFDLDLAYAYMDDAKLTMCWEPLYVIKRNEWADFLQDLGLTLRDFRLMLGRDVNHTYWWDDRRVELLSMYVTYPRSTKPDRPSIDRKLREFIRKRALTVGYFAESMSRHGHQLEIRVSSWRYLEP